MNIYVGTVSVDIRVPGTRVKPVLVRGHWRRRNGKKEFVKAHLRRRRVI